MGGTSSLIYANILSGGPTSQTLASAAFNAGDDSLTINRTGSNDVLLTVSGSY